MEEFERVKKEGNALFEKGQNEEALKKYQEAQKFNTNSAVIWTNMASCYLNMNLYQDALNCCEKSKLLDKNWAKAYYREGQANEKLKNYVDASCAYWDALRLEPQNTHFK